MKTRKRKKQIRPHSNDGVLQQTTHDPWFTMLDRFLVIITALVMFVLFLLHFQIEEDRPWATYTVMMLTFAVSGYLGTQITFQRPIGKVKYQIELKTTVRGTIILGSLFLIQLISNLVLSFTTVEQALYYVFAAVAEEVFFRVFLLSVAIRLMKQWDLPPMTKHVSNVVQATAFAAIHQNYYHNFPMLVSVFFGGILLGYFFLWWRDPTANILAHFVLNVIAVGPMVMELIL
jgi:membrane protease YdiL (CAAX protease family)